MVPKNPKTSASEKTRDVRETEDPLQAVILADSFETRFSPLTAERPRCLLPLANVPLIEYTLEFLASNGIDEVYVYCGAHTDQIEDYLQHSKWLHPPAPFRLELIRSTSRSIGDAMRDLDTRDVLTNDFVVLYGDVVSNMPLDTAMGEHKARRQADKNAIMTMVLREASSNDRSKADDILPLFVIDPSKQRCLHYEQLGPDTNNKYAELDSDMLTQDIEIRGDLIDCGIDICTPDVLALWSDNFDYEAPRRGFLHSVLKDYELNGKTIHTHVTSDHYAARVRDFRAYDSICRDILSRWSYPFCPDVNFFEDRSSALRIRGSYREDDTRIAKSSKIGPSVAIGRGTSVSDNSTLAHSVIGRNSAIGKNCIVEHAYVWDYVIIGDDSKLRDCIIASNTWIGPRSKVVDGALVSYGVRLVEGTSLGAGSKACKKRNKGTEIPDAKDSRYEVITETDGERGPGRGLSSLYKLKDLSISQESISTINSEASSEVETEELAKRRDSIVSAESEEGRLHAAGGGFVHDAAVSIYDSLEQGHDVSTIQLELQGLRMAANASEHQIRQAVAAGLVQFISQAEGARAQPKTVLSANKSIIERTIFDASQKEKTDQVDFLLLTQVNLARRQGGDSLLMSICNDLYLLDTFEEDLFEVDAFKQWWNDGRSTATEEMKQVREKTARFIEIVVDEDEESESEEDEDGEQ